MSVLPVSHFTWQVLRTLKRGRGPLDGRALRLVRSRRTKDGSFLTELVDDGLLVRVTGSAEAPFLATYALTERGEYAAEYGECEREHVPRPVTTPSAPRKGAKKSAPANRKGGQ